MDRTVMSLLRGVCQIPAYVAHEKGFFSDFGLNVEIDIVATAWQIPDRLVRREADFAILPWMRTVLQNLEGMPLVVVCGSGCEEAAIVVREGLEVDEVRSVALPKRGGLKDLTAMALLDSLGWTNIEEVRQPCGDGAILALVGGGADAASMVEPYATIMEERKIGRVVRRTGAVWPGAPGCALTTTANAIEQDPDLVRNVVRGFVKGLDLVERDPAQAAGIAAKYIGAAPDIIERALGRNAPDINAMRHTKAIDEMLAMMQNLGYIEGIPVGWLDLSFLDSVVNKDGNN
jgi:ABC-type nitrate/sulfonate/bicarbonate transport system substrate-binding protein